MVYKYRVTLAGIKGFYRVYKVNPSNSLYTFHKQLRADLEFPMDQQILFKGLAENDTVLARYALIDLGYGAADSVTLADTVKAGVNSFVYFYDIVSKKSVIITFEGEEEGSVSLPEVVDTKGPVPLEFENGYVAFEDLPETRRRKPSDDIDDEDDEDDDDDDESEDDDEEEIIYDENEGAE